VEKTSFSRKIPSFGSNLARAARVCQGGKTIRSAGFARQEWATDAETICRQAALSRRRVDIFILNVRKFEDLRAALACCAGETQCGESGQAVFTCRASAIRCEKLSIGIQRYHARSEIEAALARRERTVSSLKVAVHKFQSRKAEGCQTTEYAKWLCRGSISIREPGIAVQRREARKQLPMRGLLQRVLQESDQWVSATPPDYQCFFA